MTLLQAAIDGAPAPAEAPTVKLDLVGLFQNAAWPIKITIGLLLACSLLVWIIAVLKMLQLARLRSAESNFDRRARHVGSPRELFELAGLAPGAGGAHRRRALRARRGRAGRPPARRRRPGRSSTEAQGARALMWLLAFIAAGAPFIGLFGTVYGIMDAFIRIGAAKTREPPGRRARHRRGAHHDRHRPRGGDPGRLLLQLDRQERRRLRVRARGRGRRVGRARHRARRAVRQHDPARRAGPAQRAAARRRAAPWRSRPASAAAGASARSTSRRWST